MADKPQITPKTDEQLALEWKKKYNDRVSQGHIIAAWAADFRDDLAKAVGIQTARSKWWEASPKEQEQMVLERCRMLRRTNA